MDAIDRENNGLVRKEDRLKDVRSFFSLHYAEMLKRAATQSS